jgi:hypothetical protein
VRRWGVLLILGLFSVFFSVFQILMHHIKSTLPDIKGRITSQLQRYQSELASLGGAMGEGNGVRTLFTFPIICPSLER